MLNFSSSPLKSSQMQQLNLIQLLIKNTAYNKNEYVSMNTLH